MSALVRSSRGASEERMMCRSMRPVSVPTVVGFLGRPPSQDEACVQVIDVERAELLDRDAL